MKKNTLCLMLVLIFISTNAFSQNFIQGKISGAVQEGISVNLYQTCCGSDDVLVDTITTNSEGYYGFGCLANGVYRVVPDKASYIFNSEFYNVLIPQTELKSYDFTTTNTCNDVDRFLDNLDGTVTDCRTGLIWLKNANCWGARKWGIATSSAEVLNSGECGLTDESEEGGWRLPTKNELQGIGTDPPTTWEHYYSLNLWTMPGEPFVNVQAIYWSSTGQATGNPDGYQNYAWFIRTTDGYTNYNGKDNYSHYVWPVRSAD